MAKAYAVLGADIKKAPTAKDRRLTMMMERVGPKAAAKAVMILFSSYCAQTPALMLSSTAQTLRLTLFGSLDRAVWQEHLCKALADQDALEAAERLEKMRTVKHMEEGRFLESLLGALKRPASKRPAPGRRRS